MKNTSHSHRIGFTALTLLLVAGITALVAGAVAAPPLAHADADIEIDAVKGTIGPRMSWIQCPCFRWVMQVQVAGGQIETRDFLISSESLFKFHRGRLPSTSEQFASRLFTVAPVEALWKTGHIGIGFSGVTFGENKDLGYSNLIQTGLYALVNAFLTDAVRLDIHSGADYETMRVNYGPQIDRVLLDQAAIFKWKAGSWSGNVQGRVGFDSAHLTDPAYIDAAASPSVRWQMVRMGALDMGLSLTFSYEHDGLRSFMGLIPDMVSGSLLMDMSSSPARTRSTREPAWRRRSRRARHSRHRLRRPRWRQPGPLSAVAPYCMTQDSAMGQFISSDPTVLAKTYLTPECLSALLQVIPYDATSWATAPAGMQDRVTEAFQAIIAYPLAVSPTDTQFLGTQPALAGAIPVAFFNIYQEYPNPNQALFNYILNHADQIVYGGNNPALDAMYSASAPPEVRTIFIYQSFWNPAVYLDHQHSGALCPRGHAGA